MEFFRPEYWSGQLFPSPGDLPNPGIEHRSPALRADSLPAEPKGKPKNTGVGSLSLLQRIFLTQESHQGLPHCRQILYQLSYQGSHVRCEWNCSLPSVSCCWRSFSSSISHLSRLLSSVTFLASSLDANPCMPAVVLLYFSEYCNVRLKMFSLFFVLFFMCYMYEKCYKPVIVQYYIADCVSWVPTLILSDLRRHWT